MTDLDPADQPEETPTPAETPVAVDLSQFSEILDKRFSGFQGLIDRKFGEFATELDQLRAANLSPEEQQQLEDDKRKREYDRLKRENALLKLRKQYPEEVDFLENFFSAQTLEEQVLATSSFRRSKAEETAESDTEEESPEPSPVNPNNPRRRTKPSLADGTQEMTAELADEILRAADEPGILVKLRRQVTGG